VVTLAGILSPVRPPAAGEVWPVRDETKIRLRTLLDKMAELVKPLSSVETRGELKKVLDRIAPQYLHLRNEFGRLTMHELNMEQFVQLATEVYDELQNLIGKDVAVLGEEDRELLLDVVESLREMLHGALGDLADNQGLLNDIVLESGSALQRLDMCLLAILLVLVGETARWNPGSIRLLSRVAQAYMDEVQDIFLVHDSELHNRLRTREQTVSLEEVKKEVELPSRVR